MAGIMRNTVSFNENTCIKKEPIIVYGASVYGELAYVALAKMGCYPNYYCDKSKDRKEYFGIKVISPEALHNLKNANIIIASADFFYEIKRELENIGCCNLFDMVELINMELPKEKMSNRAREMYANRQYYMNIVRNQSGEQLIFNRIQYVVSERCSLKCKDCSHLMQYYQHPQDIDLCEYKEAFELLLKTADYIAELRILGGEPFMNSKMDQVIEWYHNSDKIQSISIYTNGTIIPNEAILQALQKDKVKVHISNYKINEEKIQKLLPVFDKYHIEYFVRDYDSWQDAGGVECRGYSLEQKKAVFSRCFERNGFAFLKGRLYRCPRVAHTMNLGAMPDIKSDYVDLQHWSGTKAELKRQLKNLQECLWLEGCNYCDGPDNHTQSIPAARQISQPLAYKPIDTEK